MTTSARRRLIWALSAIIVAAGLWPVLLTQLVQASPQHWQVDLSVYRGAGRSVLDARQIYEYLAPPQFLPFTYPPFAALLAVPLALVPFTVAGWCWFLAQAVADVAIASYAVWPFARRAGAWAPVVCAAASAVTFHLLPVHDGLRFAQVDAFLLLAVIIDLRRPRWWRRVPPGLLIGLATAIKLTPGLFIVHLLLTGRRREAGNAVVAAVGATFVGLILLPRATLAYWGDALLDSSRLGPNYGTSNQSLRGLLLRLGPGGITETVLWALLVVAVLVVGMGLARTAYLGPIRPDPTPPSARFVPGCRMVGDTKRALGRLFTRVRASAGRDEQVRLEVALVGMVTVLVSPVSWIHHFVWIVLVVGALLGTGRDVRRVVAAVAVCVVFLLDLPWWGQWRLVPDGQAFPADSNGDVWGVLMNNSYGLMALVCLGLLAWSMRRATRIAGQR